VYSFGLILREPTVQTNRSSPDYLNSICERVEALCLGSIAGFTICDPQRSHIERALFPKLPSSFSAAITNVPLEPSSFGSCVQAIARGEVITCEDIESDTCFDSRWRGVCLDHGLRSIQSRPMFVNGIPCGTFVLAFREPRAESSWNDSLMKFAADAAAAAISQGIADPGK
jgi:GAF domain-containing protein